MIPDFDIPTLHIGPLVLDSFSFLVSLAFIVGTLLAARRARLVGLDEKVMFDIGLISITAGITGAHLAVVFIYHPEEFLKRPLWLFQIWSGISSWGGFVGAAIAIYFYMKKKGLPFAKYADALMFGLTPGWFLGRMGCFSVHDHLGKITHFFLALRFPKASRHDLGLDEALLTLPLIAWVYYVGRKKSQDNPAPGTIYSTVIVAYAVIRFFLDFLRADDIVQTAEPHYFGLTPAQYYCILSAGFGLFLHSVYLRPRKV